MNRSLTYIDDYSGVTVQGDTPYSLRMKIMSLPGNFQDDMLMIQKPNETIVSTKPNDCYARYIQDHRDESKYNCEIIDFTDTNKITLIATKNIFADDELFCDWDSNKIRVVTNEDQRKQKPPTKSTETETTSSTSNNLETEKIVNNNNQDTPIPKELVQIADSGVDKMYDEYYQIPNYKNKYKTQDLLVIGRSRIPGAGLGLFAFVPIEVRNEPRNRNNWSKPKKGPSKFLLFQGYPRLADKTTYIDEYKGELLKTKTKEEMKALLKERRTKRSVFVTNTISIDATSPTDCYSQYANDSKRMKGFSYNAALISSAKTKTAAIIAIKNIYVYDEIFVDYGNEFWLESDDEETVEENINQPKKKQKQTISEDIEYV